MVAHGDILRWIVDGESQRYLSTRVCTPPFITHCELIKQQWMNCEVKIFSFESDDDDEDAKMVEVPAEGKVPRDATDDPTTEEMT